MSGTDELFEKTYDPYDLWATPVGVFSKRLFLRNRKLGLPFVGSLVLLEWLSPRLIRRALHASKTASAIAVSLKLMRHLAQWGDQEFRVYLDTIEELGAKTYLANGDLDEIGWGLPFVWVDARAMYTREDCFIAHSAYVLEACIAIKGRTQSALVRDRVDTIATAFSRKLARFQVLAKPTGQAIAYSSRADEAVAVVNAASYAAFSIALLKSEYGDAMLERFEQLNEQLVDWILSVQRPDGSWLYSDLPETDTFIDCFHSCFVCKNLLKASALSGYRRPEIEQAVAKCATFIKDNFIDADTGLSAKFALDGRNYFSPFVYELYDQAEYLGLLIDLDRLEQARAFNAQIVNAFVVGSTIYTRIDKLGRKSGEQYNRWGIEPYKFQLERLNACAE